MRARLSIGSIYIEKHIQGDCLGFMWTNANMWHKLVHRILVFLTWTAAEVQDWEMQILWSIGLHAKKCLFQLSLFQAILLCICQENVPFWIWRQFKSEKAKHQNSLKKYIRNSLKWEQLYLPYNKQNILKKSVISTTTNWDIFPDSYGYLRIKWCSWWETLWKIKAPWGTRHYDFYIIVLKHS